MDKAKAYLPGLLLCTGLSLLVALLARLTPWPGGVAGALLLGLVVGNSLGVKAPLQAGVRFGERRVLSLAIAFMGVELQLAVLHRMGLKVMFLAAATVLFSLSSSYFLGRLLGFSRPMALLLGTGNSVCGSSAIAAMAPAIGARDEDVGLSIGAVNLLGTLGIVIIPLLALGLGLNDLQASVLTGGSLQAVGQVAAAGFSMGENVGRWALVVKMSRVLMIVPLVLLVPLILRLRHEGPTGGKGKGFPLYILGFVSFSVLGTLLGPATEGVWVLKTVGGFLMMVAMVAIGLSIRVGCLLRAAPRALLVLVLATTLQVGFLLLFILSGWIS